MFYYQGQIIRSSNCCMNEEKINAMFFTLWEIFTKQMEKHSQKSITKLL